MAFIATEIEENCCIMIDEPENSLHPTWQKNYIETILDFFHSYQPRTVIATHSPIIVSGGEIADERTRVFEMLNSRAKEYANPNLNLEEMYERLFGLITPKNRYLSQRAVELLDAVNEGSLDAVGAKKILSELCDKSYDEQQINMIKGVGELAEKVEKARRKND